MIYALAILAILSPLAGFVLGVYLARRSGAHTSHAHERAVTFLREGEALRHVVMDFVRRARHEHPPTLSEWHALVEAMLHSGTPYGIRRAHHRQCGTALPDEVTDSGELATEEPERKLVRCPHGNEWYEPPPDGIATIGCSLCGPNGPVTDPTRVATTKEDTT